MSLKPETGHFKLVDILKLHKKIWQRNIFSVMQGRMKKVAMILTVTKTYRKVIQPMTIMPNPSTSMINMNMTSLNRKMHEGQNKVFVKE